MNLNRIIQSLLIMLVVVGVFAAMARNTYGFTLLGIASLGLAMLYLVELIWKLIDDYSTLETMEIPELMELFLLAGLLLLFGLRAFYVRLPNSDLIFMSLCMVLFFVYCWMGWAVFRATKRENPALAIRLPLFYSAILLFLLSLVIRLIYPTAAGVIGATGALVSIPFLILVAFNKRYDHVGRSITIIQFIIQTKNKAGLLFLFFMMSVVYVAFSNFKIIPAVENAEKPRDYIQMIDKAEGGLEKPVNGKYRYEVYQEAMDRFLKRHAKK